MAGEVPVYISPIDVEFEGNTGRYRHVDTVGDLAAMLLSQQWSWSNAPSFHRAIVTSMEALEFDVEAADARAAFVIVAHEFASRRMILPSCEERSKKEPHQGGAQIDEQCPRAGNARTIRLTIEALKQNNSRLHFVTIIHGHTFALQTVAKRRCAHSFAPVQTL
ncbi:DUF982 domain-containing protein [Rhizobium sp. 3T7]|uniref:DUF982 domain-containing protein n=1 Tax=Rhizobium sp. 3T7 TaxID=2874922 RepID=UPI001CCD258D|nr:DUF982 domain-containing protein [Rhizobium sp. 3T7]MBZ9790930.1 DUF982 domain-containing protein [Rhizobium sp. 3T7]